MRRESEFTRKGRTGARGINPRRGGGQILRLPTGRNYGKRGRPACFRGELRLRSGASGLLRCVFALQIFPTLFLIRGFAINRAEILPLPHPPWDTIKVEIWPDSGQIVIYPWRKDARFRIETGTCLAVSSKLLEDYDSIDDTSMSGEEFSHAVQSLILKIARLVETSLKSPGLRASLPLQHLQVACFSTEEHQPMHEFTVN